MAKWKSNNENNNNRTARFLQFEEGKEKTIKITDWNFDKGPGGYLFKCYVVEEDGEEADKIWTVWDYESTQLLKKKLKGQGPKKIKVRMFIDDEDEQCFEFV